MIQGLLSISRLLQYAAILGTCGAVLFYADGARLGAQFSGSSGAALRVMRWLTVSVCIGCAATAAWLALESELLTGNWTSWSVLILHTRFGRITTARLLLLLLFGAALSVRRSTHTGTALALLAAAAAASLAWAGHGLMGEGLGRWVHVVADTMHVLCATVWIGALVALTVQALSCPAGDAQAAGVLGQRLARFSTIGPALVATLAATGAVNSFFLLGPAPWQALWATGYGRLLTAKLALFMLMLALAALNRLRLAPALKGGVAVTGWTALRASPLQLLRLSLLTESFLAALVLAVVAVIGNLAPPASG